MKTVEQRVPVTWAVTRALVLVGIALAAATGAITLTRAPLVTLWGHMHADVPWRALPLDLLVEAAAAAVLLGCAVWLALGVTITVAELVLTATTGISLGVARAVTPAVVRRGVALTCGLAVGGSALAGPAVAAPAGISGTTQPPAPTSHYTPVPPVAGPLTGLPLPDRARGAVAPRRVGSGGSAAAAPSMRRDLGTESDDPTGFGSSRPLQVVPASATTSVPDRPRSPRHHVVRPGDTLWGIATQHLPRATPERVDASWRALYRANRDVVGADPDLLVPGTSLRLPPRTRSERPDRPGDLPAATRKDPS